MTKSNITLRSTLYITGVLAAISRCSQLIKSIEIEYRLAHVICQMLCNILIEQQHNFSFDGTWHHNFKMATMKCIYIYITLDMSTSREHY